MKIKEKFNEINVDSFIFDYIKACGVEDVERYLSPTWDDRENPCDYDNMKEAYECLVLHHVNGDSAGILIDCDMDGDFSGSLLHNHLLDIEYGGQIIPFFHEDKKHGLTDKEVFERIKTSGIKLLFCPDSSSGDYEQHKELKEMGIDVIILDHHNCDTYSEHAIVINNQLSDKIKNKHGSGCLVTHKFCQYIDLMTGFDFAEKYYDRVALSLITDVCDIRSQENRFYLSYGFDNIGDELIKLLIQEKLSGKEINSHNLSWNVNPCLNSAVRNNKSESIYEALVFPCHKVLWQRVRTEKEKEWRVAEKAFKECLATQTKQQNDVRKYMKKLAEQVNDDDKVIIAETDDKFNFAYTGLVAGKLSQEFGKPALVVHETNGKYIGSVRSDSVGRQVFNDSGLFIYNSGHDFGAWGTCFFVNKLDDIKQYFGTLDLSTELTCEVAKCYKPSTIPKELFESIEANMGVFGKGIEVPQFAFTFTINSSDINWYSTVARFLVDGISFVKFFPNAAMKKDFFEGESKTLEVTIIGTLGINEYNGYRNPQVVIQNYEVKEKKRILDWEDIF